MPVSSWSTTPASNNSAPPNGWPEGMAPSAVNDTARQMMADIRSMYDGGVGSSTARPMFNAQRTTSTQPLPFGSVTDLLFNTENTDQASNYAPGTGIFTAPVAGLYLFNASAQIANSSGGVANLTDVYFSKNNTTSAGNAVYSLLTGALTSVPPLSMPNSFQHRANGSVILLLAAADTVRIKLDNNATGSNLTLVIGSWFSGVLIG